MASLEADGSVRVDRSDIHKTFIALVLSLLSGNGTCPEKEHDTVCQNAVEMANVALSKMFKIKQEVPVEEGQRRSSRR